MAIDKIDCLTGDGIREVFVFLHGLAASDDGVVGVVVGFICSHMIGVDEFTEFSAFGVTGWEDSFAKHGGGAVPWGRDEVMSFVGETEKFVEAMAEGMVGGGAAEVPFSDDAGGVSLIVEKLGEGGFLFWQSEAGFLIPVAGGIEFVSEACGNTSGEEARA